MAKQPNTRQQPGQGAEQSQQPQQPQQDADDRIVDDVPQKTEPAPPPPERKGKAAVTSEFTRCWRVRHRHFGVRQVLADSQEEAVNLYLEKVVPGGDHEEVRKGLIVSELSFVPADTERNQPYGWKRPRPGQSPVKVID